MGCVQRIRLLNFKPNDVGTNPQSPQRKVPTRFPDPIIRSQTDLGTSWKNQGSPIRPITLRNRISRLRQNQATFRERSWRPICWLPKVLKKRRKRTKFLVGGKNLFGFPQQNSILRFPGRPPSSSPRVPILPGPGTDGARHPRLTNSHARVRLALSTHPAPHAG